MNRRTIETRLLIQHFAANTAELQASSRKLIGELQDESAFLPTIVLHELYKIEFETLGRQAAETRFNILLQSNFELMKLDTEIAKQAAILKCHYSRLPTADAIIAATAIVTRSFHVVADVPQYKTIKELKTDKLWVVMIELFSRGIENVSRTGKIVSSSGQ